MIWFSSDTHYHHYKDFLGRPFQDERMDTLLIENYNALVKPTDIMWFLGDFALHATPEQMIRIFSQLNGSKHLVKGNHDNPKTLKLKWASIHDVHTLHHEGNIFFLSHYSHRIWSQKHFGAYHLYGHSHGRLPNLGRSMDVGVDNKELNYSPISIDGVIEKLKPVPFEGGYL